MIKIELQDLLVENPKSVYACEDIFFLQLYYFFKTHSQEEIYLIACSSDESRLDAGQVKTLIAYGIYFDNYDAIMSNGERQFIIIPEGVLESEDSLTNYLEKILLTGKTPGYCFVEKYYSADDAATRTRDLALINLALPTSLVLNVHNKNSFRCSTDNFAKLSDMVNPETGNYYKTENISDLIKGVGSSLGISEYINNAVAIVNEIVARQFDRDTILYVNYSELSRADINAYVAIAAYLLLGHDIRCHVDASDRSQLSELVHIARTQDYMFFSDYLNSIKSFPDFSISCVSNRCYVWFKDYMTMNKAASRNGDRSKYDIKLSLYKAAIDVDSWTLLEPMSSQCYRISANRISHIRDFRDMCDIGSKDIETAMVSYEKLNRLFREINSSLHELGKLENDAFAMINNVLLYEQGGIHYVAYVNNISGLIPFIVYPMWKGAKPFRSECYINEINALNDTKLYYDSYKACAPVINHLGGHKITQQHYDMGTLRGILLKGYRQNSTTINKNVSLSFAEIGMWAEQTSIFRMAYRRSFTDMFNKTVALDRNLISMFGIKHPQISTSIIVTNDLWRYKN